MNIVQRWFGNVHRKLAAHPTSVDYIRYREIPYRLQHHNLVESWQVVVVSYEYCPKMVWERSSQPCCPSNSVVSVVDLLSQVGNSIKDTSSTLLFRTIRGAFVNVPAVTAFSFPIYSMHLSNDVNLGSFKSPSSLPMYSDHRSSSSDVIDDFFLLALLRYFSYCDCICFFSSSTFRSCSISFPTFSSNSDFSSAIIFSIDQVCDPVPPFLPSAI